MIVNKYQGNGGGGGGSYVLPPATANRLGGIKVGSGLTITNDGTLSASGGTAPSGEGNVKVYMYDELFSGSTYDHTDLSVPNEMVALASSGTPVYVLYRDDDKSVYMALTDYSGNALHFNGDNGALFMHCSLSKVLPWMMSRAVSDRIGDYKVVSQLPNSAFEGQLFYVPAHTGTIQYNGLTLTTNETENYVGHLYDAGNNEKAAVYISGTDFHWGWENDGEMHHQDDFYYKTDNQNKTFIFYAPDGWYITADNDTITGETEGFSVQVTIAPATYRYTGNAFRKEVVKIKINDFKGADYGFNSNNLYDYLQQFTEEELKQNFVFEHDGKYAKYVAYNESSEAEYTHYLFEVMASSVVYPIGTPSVSPRYTLYVYTDGHIGSDGQNEVNIFLPIRMTVNLIDSGLTSQNSGALWVRATDYSWGGNPFIAVITDGEGGVLGYTQNCWFRQAYDSDNSDWVDLGMDSVKIFGCEWYQYGDKITAEWAVSNDGNVIGGAPINWIVTSNVHSAADSTIPTNS